SRVAAQNQDGYPARSGGFGQEVVARWNQSGECVMTNDRNDLERFVHGLARSQPARRAPLSLESRVLREIAAQQVAWWRGGFVHWPLYARVALIAVSCGCIRLAVAGIMWITDLFGSQEVAGAATLHRSAQVLSTTVSAGELVLHVIPPMWLYGG